MRATTMMLALCLFALQAGNAMAGAGEVSMGCASQTFERPLADPPPIFQWMHRRAERRQVKSGLVAINFRQGDSLEDINTAAGLCAYAPLVDEQLSRFYIRLVGRIDGETADALASILDALTDAEKELHRRFIEVRLVLDSPGGDMVVARKFGTYLFGSGLPVHTMVLEPDICASSCLALLAAGKRRSVDGRVGIHRMVIVPDGRTKNDSDAQYMAAYQEQVDKLRSYFDKMGIRKSLVDEMLRISSDDVRVLSDSELRHYGLNQDNPYLAERSKGRMIADCGVEWYRRYNQRLDKAARACAQSEGSRDQAYACMNDRLSDLREQCPAYYGTSD